MICNTAKVNDPARCFASGMININETPLARSAPSTFADSINSIGNPSKKFFIINTPNGIVIRHSESMIAICVLYKCAVLKYKIKE